MHINYFHVNLDRIALQFALTNVNPRRLYRLKMVLDFSSLFLIERQPASFDNAATDSEAPQHP